MLFFFELLKVCLGGLSIVSPDKLANSNVSISLAAFGNPSVFEIYGRLRFVNLTNCNLNQQFMNTDLIIVFNIVHCFYSDIALSVQNSGAGAVIFADPDWYSDTLYLPKDLDSGNHINILVIGISDKQAYKYLEYENIQIWATYIIDLSGVSSPPIYYFLVNDNVIDKNFFNNLQQLNNMSPIPIDQLTLIIQYYPNTASNPLDCIFSQYCMNSSNNVSGQDLLKNSIGIVNYLNFLQQSSSDLSNFLTFVLDIYTTCSLNYSNPCVASVFSTYNVQMNISSIILNVFGSSTVPPIYPYYQISNFVLYWINNLQTTYCWISLDSSSACPPCSPLCHYNTLRANNDCNNCNTSSCGYSNLECLKKDNCYSFMIGDGNCNANCIDDPDCIKTAQGNKGSNTTLIIIIVATVVGGIIM